MAERIGKPAGADCPGRIYVGGDNLYAIHPEMSHVSRGLRRKTRVLGKEVKEKKSADPPGGSNSTSFRQLARELLVGG